MANGKKSFVAYADWKDTFDNLPNEVAGKLIKHIFSYVNDENPNSDDFVINALFANIKNTLKRDLDKWENQLEQRREAGRKSAEKRASTKFNDRSTKLNEAQRNSTVSDSVSVSDSVILLEKETKDIFRFYKELEKLGAEKDLLNDWNKVRKKKKATDTKTSLEKFISQVYLSGKDINEILRICIEKDWKGFEADWIKKEEQKNLSHGTKQITAKPKFRNTFANLANQHGQAEAGNTEGELFEDTEYTELE